MCEYCAKHGAGKKWYLEARNYLRNKLETDKKRTEFTRDFVAAFMNNYDKYLETGKIHRMIDTDNPDFLHRLGYTWYFKKQHSGQVLPVEDAKETVKLAGQASLVPCVCRFANAAEKKHVCMVYMNVPDDLWGAKHFNGIRDIEPLSVEDTQTKLDEFAEAGYVQTIWTFLSPHIGAVCNCDYPYCTAVRARRNTRLKQPLLKGHYVAKIDASKCSSCQQCLKKCQFGALNYSVSTDEVHVNELECFGCGACRFACTRDAISLVPREESPIAANLW